MGSLEIALKAGFQPGKNTDSAGTQLEEGSTSSQAVSVSSPQASSDLASGS